MSILSNFIQNTKNKNKFIGIGLDSEITSAKRIIYVSEKLTQESANKVLLVGKKNSFKNVLISEKLLNRNIFYKEVVNPSNFLIDNLINSKNVEVQPGIIIKLSGIIRGNLSSNIFLKEIKLIQKNDQINRLALLETSEQHQFFYIGVGIDEINSFDRKKQFIIQSMSFLKKIGISPKIGILSGGRVDDIGRDSNIDKNIINAKKLAEFFNIQYPKIQIKHYEILIEEAIKDKVNLLIAPEGISGNLIYRTLVHLGSGKSYGAIYLTIHENFNKVIIDCSRDAPDFEYRGSFYFCLGLK